MTAVHVGTWEPGSPEWETARATRIGGSEIAPICNLSEYADRFTVWNRKKGLVPPQPENEVMEWGNRLEPAVLEKFLEGQTDGKPRVKWGSGKPGSYVRDDRSWQLATPDDILADPDTFDRPYALVEAKTARVDIGWGEAGSNEIPVGYRCQVLWNLDVFGLRKCWVPVLIGGSDYREYFIDLDTDADAESDLNILLQQGQRFINSLRTNERPEIETGQAYQTVRELHPDIDGDDIEISPTLAGDYMAAVIAEKDAKADKDLYGARLLDAMGSARNACVDGVRFAYRTARKTKDGEPGVPFLALDRKRLDQLTTTKTIKGRAA